MRGMITSGNWAAVVLTIWLSSWWSAEVVGGEQPAAPYEVQVQAGIEFANVEGVPLLMDLHSPKGVERPPLVVFIHGGGWKNGDRKRCKLAWAAGYGYAVASIEYRLSHEAVFPAQIHDCKGAIRWLRANQAKYGFDASRVVAAGSSAGGHLAALLGASGGVQQLEGGTAGHADQSSKVQGVIDYYGPSDFLLRAQQQPEKTESPSGSVYQLLGGAATEHPKMATLASPVAHVGRGDPPLLILHGDADRVVPISQSRRLADVYHEHRLDVRLHIEKEQGHGWPGPTPGEQEAILDFLNQHLSRN